MSEVMCVSQKIIIFSSCVKASFKIFVKMFKKTFWQVNNIVDVLQFIFFYNLKPVMLKWWHDPFLELHQGEVFLSVCYVLSSLSQVSWATETLRKTPNVPAQTVLRPDDQL